jgi:hypothetical protein
MTPIAALENHARALNEALEDCHGYTADDFRRVCYARMCECLGIPLRDQGLALKLSKRRGIGEVRRLVPRGGRADQPAGDDADRRSWRRSITSPSSRKRGSRDVLRHRRPLRQPVPRAPGAGRVRPAPRRGRRALIGAMADADVPPQYRLRLINRFNGRLLASEFNPNCREAQ